MNHRLAIFPHSFSLDPGIPILFALRRLPCRLLVLLTVFSLTASAQNWSSFLDPSRAVDWSGAGFSIPTYSVNCSNQPTLLNRLKQRYDQYKQDSKRLQLPAMLRIMLSTSPQEPTMSLG